MVSYHFNFLNAYDAMASYNMQMEGCFRVVAMSALEYAGLNHYVTMGKPVLMVAAPTFKTLLWMQSDVYDVAFRVFHTNAFSDIETKELILITLGTMVDQERHCLLLLP